MLGARGSGPHPEDVVVGDRARWLQAAAQIIDASDPHLARATLIEALQRQTGAGLVTHVHLVADEIDLFVTGDLPYPPSTHWPSAAAVRGHPINRYHEESGDHAPVLMTDVLNRGWQLDGQSRDTMRALGITEHQLSVPVTGPGADYDGWVLVLDEPFGRRAVTMLTELQPLIRALDRHVRHLPGATPPGSAHRPDNHARLTAREQVILSLMARGGTAAGIAARLAISPRTVHKHQENLYRKLGAVDRLSAVLAAQRLGLLPERQAVSGIPASV
jgi:DNA-binding CsgD family transcriptional regulator